MEVHFRISCSETSVGQHVRVVGSGLALGHWDPKFGMPLQTSAPDFPVWRSSTGGVVLEEDTAVEYKYVICDSAGDVIMWENTPNRTLHVVPAPGQSDGAQRSAVSVSERWNLICQLDRLHFSHRLAPAPGAGGGGNLGGGLGRLDFPERQEGESLFEPTMRERVSSSKSFLGTPRRSASLSSFIPAAWDPEVANPSFEDAVMGEGHGIVVNDAGLVREESCSNLFFGGEEVYHERRPQAWERQASQEFAERYALLGDGPLGEGTFGLVWRCSRRQKGGRGEEERAAKTVRKARLNDQERRFLLGEDGEISTHLTMKHPHIVELFEYFDEHLTVTLVLEFCHGGDLFDAIVSEAKRQQHQRGGGLSERQAAVATQHTLSALAYVHSQQVVHRDIKCENILLAKQGVPLEHNVFKLCDFGFAAHDRGLGLRDRLGSPDTVAPEVVAGSRYSFSADLWSMGTLVYMMLAATPPFKAPTDADVLRKVRTGSYSLNGALWDSITAPPKHVVTSLMVVDPKLRPTAAETLEKAWFEDVPPLSPAASPTC